ncbi:MAG: putative acetyltransferase [Lachnospiraceae bacterium]|jgi:predicted GNAT family acetyltransferase|nr:putative acetyltransferase [Lachnospiraceae bacterium]
MNWKYEDGRIYSTDEQGELLSEATYIQNQPEEIIINHVYVNPSLRGQGVADQTMLVVIDYLRKKNLKAAATCPYASAWFQRNKEKCADILIK